MTNANNVSESRLMDELRDMIEYWHDTIEAKKSLRQWYRKEYPVRIAESENILIPPYEFRSGRYSEIVDRTKGLIRVDTQYSIEAKGLGPHIRADAERAQDWLNNAPAEIELAQGQSFDDDLCFELVNYGYSGRCVFPDPQRWANYPDLGDRPPSDYRKLLREFGELAPFPIAAYHIPILTWRPMLSGRLVLKSYQIQELRVGQVRHHFPDAEITASKKSTDKLQYITIIDDECVYYMLAEGAEDGLSGVLSFAREPWKHHMPVPKGTAPVALYEGMTTGESDIRYRWKGYAEDIRDAIEAQDLLISAQVTRAAASSIPTAMLKLDPQMNPTQADKLKDMKFNMFGTNVTIPGADWTFADFGQQHPVEEAAYAKFDQLINSRYPPAMRGELNGESGYAYNQSARYAELIAKPLVLNAAAGDIDFGRLLFLSLAALKEMAGGEDVPVAVRVTKEDHTEAISVTWTDVESYGPLIRARREATMPIDEQAQLQATQMAIDAGLPRAHAWENYAKKENPQELADEALAEKLINESPVLAKQREDAILRRMGALRDAEEGLTPEQAATMAPLPPAAQTMLAALGAVPPGSTPQLAGVPSPGLGGNSVVPVTPPVQPPVTMEQPPMASKGIAVRSGKRRRPRNPRAGQRTQPGGPHIQTGSVQVGTA